MTWISLLLSFAFAQTPQTPQPSVFEKRPAPEAKADEVDLPSDIGSSAFLRQQARIWVTLSFSPLDFLVPRKIGASAGFSPEPQSLYELEYLKSRYSPLVSSDLGTFNDQRISLLYRSFGQRNSFNYQIGLSHLSTNMEIGNQLYQKIIGHYPYVKAFEIQAIGLQFGLGNEWIFSKKYLIPVRIDWIAVTQPIFSLKQDAPILDFINDGQTKDSINAVLAVAKWAPKFAFFKIQAGFAL